MSETVNKGGRPKVQLTDLREGWKEGIIALSEEGASLVELACYLQISRDLMYRLIADEVEFSDTIKICKQKCESWWQRQGRVNLGNKEFQSTLWYMNMKNRFKWADKQEVEHSGEVSTQAQVIISLPSNGRDEEKQS